MDVEELTAWSAGAPDGDGGVAALLRLVEPPDEGGDDVRILRVIVIAGAVEIGRHGAVIEQPVLGAVVLAEF